MSITRESRYYKDTYRTYVIRLNRKKDQELIQYMDKLLEDQKLTSRIKMLMWIDMEEGDQNGERD